MLFVAGLIIFDGLTGPKLAPKNLAGTIGWVHYRGLLILLLLAFGNFFCMGCPMMFVRDLSRKVVNLGWRWPIPLRNKWLAVGLFFVFLFCYEAFSLWESPLLTAAIAIAYFTLAIGIDTVFAGSSFCKYVCPVGQFSFLSSTMSPFEVVAKDAKVCGSCTTKDCINGRFEQTKLVARGCERDLFLPSKVGNLDCTFCLDCAVACPKSNVALQSRLPGSEIWEQDVRSGIGKLYRRYDWGVLATIFTFGALLNIFGMVSPVYALQSWLGISNRTALWGVLCTMGLIIEPAILIALVGYLTKTLTRSTASFSAHRLQVAYALLPLGVGVWAAHYLFHFLTGVLTVIPVAQSFLVRHGLFTGTPAWQLSGIPERFVAPLEMGFLFLGLLGTVIVSIKNARQTTPQSVGKGAFPTVVLALVLWVMAMWLLNQPMEMRGTLFG